jgi:hypothetical protein
MTASYSNVYFLVILRGIDILACTWIWRDYDITISSMAGLELRKPTPARWARVLGGFLNWLQKNHCEMAIAADDLRCLQAHKILNPSEAA